MATYNPFKLTSDGIDIQYKAQTAKTLKFTKFKLGSGDYTGNIRELHDLVKPELTTEVTRLKVTGADNTRKVIIGFNLNNKDMQTGFYLKEIGIFAEDPETKEEKLVFYTNASDAADYIASNASATVLEKIFDVELYITDVENITAEIDTSLIYVTQQDFTETITGITTDLSSAEMDISDIQGDITNLKEDVKPQYIKNYVLKSTDGYWMQDFQKDSEYYYTIGLQGITENHRVNIYMDNENQAKMSTSYTTTDTGHIYIRSQEKPADDVTVNLEIVLVKEVMAS